MAKFIGCVSPQRKSENQCNATFYFVLYILKVPSTTDTMLYLGFNVVLKISLSILAWEAGRQGHFKNGF